jgi:hypothetical protein
LHRDRYQSWRREDPPNASDTDSRSFDGLAFTRTTDALTIQGLYRVNIAKVTYLRHAKEGGGTRRNNHGPTWRSGVAELGDRLAAAGADLLTSVGEAAQRGDTVVATDLQGNSIASLRAITSAWEGWQ